MPASLKASAGLTQDRGLLLVTVDENGPAGSAGFTLGDIIVAIDGQPVEGLESLRGQLAGDRVGTSIAVTFLRGGATREQSVTIGEQG